MEIKAAFELQFRLCHWDRKVTSTSSAELTLDSSSVIALMRTPVHIIMQTARMCACVWTVDARAGACRPCAASDPPKRSYRYGSISIEDLLHLWTL